MDIKRYNIFMDGFEGFWDCEESPTGDWIKASDVNKIKADAIREAVDKLALEGLGTDKTLLEYADELEQRE